MNAVGKVLRRSSGFFLSAGGGFDGSACNYLQWKFVNQIQRAAEDDSMCEEGQKLDIWVFFAAMRSWPRRGLPIEQVSPE